MGYERMSAAMTRAVTACEQRLSWQQFGQPDDETAWNGGTACTHVVLQILTYLYTGRILTIDQISAKAGYPYQPRNSVGQPRGMNNTEFQRAITNIGLPYVLRFGLTFDTIYQYLDVGPVFVAVRHGSIPEWKGYKYGGLLADGRPNGFARRNGRTQLTGFENGRHAGLMLGKRRYYSDVNQAVVTRDTIIRRSPSLDGQKLGSVNDGAVLKVTDTVTGDGWSTPEGLRGNTWHKITSINGRSTLSRWGRAYAFIAAGLTSPAAPSLIRTDVWRKDPNHNSGSRPENPAYDIISKTQARIEYTHFKTMLGSNYYCALPTRRLGLTELEEADDRLTALLLSLPESKGEPPAEDGADDAVPMDEAA